MEFSHLQIQKKPPRSKYYWDSIFGVLWSVTSLDSWICQKPKFEKQRNHFISPTVLTMTELQTKKKPLIVQLTTASSTGWENKGRIQQGFLTNTRRHLSPPPFQSHTQEPHGAKSYLKKTQLQSLLFLLVPLASLAPCLAVLLGN